MFLGKNEVILFQGDSVTDCGRDREDICSLGSGYPFLIASLLPAVYTGSDLTFINKGISGNRIGDLEERWNQDCIDIKPTILSILIGVNDVWRKFDSNDPISEELFEKRYRNVLKRTTDETDAKIIIMEPFVLPVSEERISWRPELDLKLNIIRSLAMEFRTGYIALDSIFAQACIKKQPTFWAEDGVHPTNAGHGLIANAWMNEVK